MANAANILPNYSMNENKATNLIHPNKNVLNEATGKDAFDYTWKNNNKYYYYNLDMSGNNNLKSIFKNDLLTGNIDASGGLFESIDDAIDNAACGNWTDASGICNGNSFKGRGKYKNTNILNNPKNDTVCHSLNNFITEATAYPNIERLLDCSGDAVPRDVFNASTSYLISRLITEKSRFYSTEPNATNTEKYTGIDGWKNTLNLTNNNAAKIFISIVYFISGYLLLVGLKSITISSVHKLGVSKGPSTTVSGSLPASAIKMGNNLFHSTFKDAGSFILFIVIMIVIFMLSGFIFSDNTKYFVLSTPSVNFLTEPCNSPAPSSANGLYITLFIILVITIFLILQNNFSNNISDNNFFNLLGFYLSNIVLVIIIFIYCFKSSSSGLGDEHKDSTYLISYDISDANSNYFLPYVFKKSNKINYTFYILLFSIVSIATVISIVLSYIEGNKKSKYFGYIYPFLTLRSPIIAVLTLLVLFKVPFIFIAYPLIILIQRLIVGNLIAPVVLDKFFHEGSKQATTSKSSQAILFETLVGWDLLAWPLFKIADVLESFLTQGGDIDKLISKNSASNINVFTAFKKEVGFNYILKFILFASPVSFAKIYGKNWPIGGVWKDILAVLLGSCAIFAILLAVSYVLIWNFNKYTYYKDNFNYEPSHYNFFSMLAKAFNINTRGILLWIVLILWGVVFFISLKNSVTSIPLRLLLTIPIILSGVIWYGIQLSSTKS